MTTAEIINNLIGPIIIAFGVFIAGALYAVTAVIKSNAKTYVFNNEAQAKERENFNDMVEGYKNEVIQLRADIRKRDSRRDEDQKEIRELYKAVAALPQLRKDLSELNGKVTTQATEITSILESRAAREKELEQKDKLLKTAYAERDEARQQAKSAQVEAVLEKERLNKAIAELRGQIAGLEARQKETETALGGTKEFPKLDEPPSSEAEKDIA
jgi:chromosome segregation ATPase